MFIIICISIVTVFFGWIVYLEWKDFKQETFSYVVAYLSLSAIAACVGVLIENIFKAFNY